jgi:hypothetical protein
MVFIATGNVVDFQPLPLAAALGTWESGIGAFDQSGSEILQRAGFPVYS